MKTHPVEDKPLKKQGVLLMPLSVLAAILPFAKNGCFFVKEKALLSRKDPVALKKL